MVGKQVFSAVERTWSFIPGTPDRCPVVVNDAQRENPLMEEL